MNDEYHRHSMNADRYQNEAARTLISEPGFQPTDNEIMIVWNAIGLAGEAGEVVDAIKKGVFHRHGLDNEQLTKELGDVCWYLAGLCTSLGIHLDDVMEANIEKLRKRYPDGFDVEASKNRGES